MTEFTNRLAVTTVEREALLLGWFFRPQDVSDQGIDAHVEKVNIVAVDSGRKDEVGSGRLIAVQIKGGPSYFESKSPNGWWFSFSAKKASLWLNHALPVILVLVDIDAGAVYWQRVSSETVQSTGKGFKLEVPRAQVMSSADGEWTHIASGLEHRAEAQYELVLSRLPPSVRSALRTHEAVSRSDTALIAMHLAEGRANPAGTVKSLLATSPVWMTRNAEWAWPVLASYAAEHDLLQLSALAFERGARANGDRRGHLFAASALNFMASDPERSRSLLDEASSAGGAEQLVAIGQSLLEHPSSDAGPRVVAEFLLEPTAENLGSAPVQGFLADQARRGGDLTQASRHCALMLQAEPENSAAMVQHADILLRQWNATGGAVEHMDEAITLLWRAINQRREWAGPTREPLLGLAQAYGLDGKFEQMLDLCLARPEGTASSEEASDERIEHYALLAACFSGQMDRVARIVDRLGESPRDRLIKMRVGLIDVSSDEAREVWSEEFRRAVAEEDYAQIAEAGVSLARLGVDVRHAMDPFVQRSIISPSSLRLAEALLMSRTDLNAALPIFRELAQQDVIAGEQMIQQLREAGRFADAAAACETLHEAGGNDTFLVLRAICLIDSQSDAAEAVARMALGSSSIRPFEKGRLHTYLGGRAADRGEWGEAERHFTEVLSLLPSPGPGEIWRVIICQLNQGKLAKASKTVDGFRPAVRNKEEAELWLHANSAIVWDQAKASEALALARRFNDPKLSTALLGRIITGTHGVDDATEVEEVDSAFDLDSRRRLAQSAVPGELHRQAFAALEVLVEEHGEATGVRIIQGEPEDLARQMADLLRDAANAELELAELFDLARDGQVPLGFVASLRGHSYASLLIQRAMGALMTASAGEEEYELELEAARGSVNRSVVIDASAMLTVSGLDFQSALTLQFVSLMTAAESVRDVHRGAFDIRGLAGSPGRMRWDIEQDSVVVAALDDDEFIRQLRRAEKMETFVANVLVRRFDGAGGFGELQDSRNAPWLHVVELARTEDLAVWSDDVGLRRLARSVNIPAFGTAALIDAIRDAKLSLAFGETSNQEAIDSAAADLFQLAADCCVDLPLTLSDLLELTEVDEYQPVAGAIALSRPAWWSWSAAPFADVIAVFDKVKLNRPEVLKSWQLAAMLGAGRAGASPDSSSMLLAMLALVGFGGAYSEDEAVEAFQVARAAALTIDVPDPVLQLSAGAISLGRMGLFPMADDQAVRSILGRLSAPMA